MCFVCLFFSLSLGMELLMHSWLTLLPSLQTPKSHLYLWFILWSTEFQHDFIHMTMYHALWIFVDSTIFKDCLSFTIYCWLIIQLEPIGLPEWVFLPWLPNDRPIFIKAQENKLNYCRILTAIAISFLEGNTW